MWQTVVSSDESEGLGGRGQVAVSSDGIQAPYGALPNTASVPLTSLLKSTLPHPNAFGSNKRASQLSRPVFLGDGVAEMRTVHVLNVEPQVSVSFIV